MPRQAPNDRLNTLLRRQEEIANQLKQLKARQKDSDRKADTRRKVIAGALALEHMSQQPDSEFSRVLYRLLDEFVDDRSRGLFGLREREDLRQTANG